MLPRSRSQQGASDEGVCGRSDGSDRQAAGVAAGCGGHEVHSMTPSESKQAMLSELAAVPVVADALDPDQVAEAVARAKPEVIVHLVGDGGGVWSFIHVADAAEATVTAVEHSSRGVYNVVDDDPAPVADWLPALAQTLGARKPMRVPRFIGRLFAGETGVMMMTELRGASNAKAKRELAWQPRHPSWRQGFAT